MDSRTSTLLPPWPMRDVRDTGLAAARHLRGDIHEVSQIGDRQTYRILFAPEGHRREILLALEEGFLEEDTEDATCRRSAYGEAAADWRRRRRDSPQR